MDYGECWWLLIIASTDLVAPKGAVVLLKRITSMRSNSSSGTGVSHVPHAESVLSVHSHWRRSAIFPDWAVQEWETRSFVSALFWIRFAPAEAEIRRLCESLLRWFPAMTMKAQAWSSGRGLGKLRASFLCWNLQPGMPSNLSRMQVRVFPDNRRSALHLDMVSRSLPKARQECELLAPTWLPRVYNQPKFTRYSVLFRLWRLATIRSTM